MMPRHTCTMEPEVARAARSGLWSADLREHVTACETCAEAVFVAFHLAGAAADLARRPLPDPRLVWLRARLDRRRSATRRVAFLITAMQALAGAVVALAAILTAARWWPAVTDAAAAAVRPAGAADRPLLVVVASLVVLFVLALVEGSPLERVRH